MTSVLVEAVRELAEACGVAYETFAVDTDISMGEVFVDGKLVQATAPCWMARLGPDLDEFKDHVAAIMYLRVVGKL